MTAPTHRELLEEAMAILLIVKGEADAGIYYENLLTQQIVPSTAKIKFFSILDAVTEPLSRIQATLKEG
jgi:hypothetical protein